MTVRRGVNQAAFIVNQHTTQEQIMGIRCGWALALAIGLILNTTGVRADTPCANGPPSLVAVGDMAVVAPGIDRLNLRLLPAVGTGVAGLLYSGYPLEVIGGPSCNGGLTWWRVQAAGGARGWVAEGTWTAYYLLPDPLPDGLESVEPLAPLTLALRDRLIALFGG
jgi:hypothetical protein